jgi:hypothetical protein
VKSFLSENYTEAGRRRLPETKKLYRFAPTVLTADGRDRLVSSGGAATRRGAAPAGGAAGGSVPDLSCKGGDQALRSGRLAFRAGDGHLFIAVPEEDLENIPALPAFEFINRHDFLSCKRVKRFYIPCCEETVCPVILCGGD